MGANRKILGALSLVLFLITALPLAQEKKTPRKPGHLFPAERVESLETGNRDEWQKPAEIMKALDIKTGDTVADIGAGGGYLTVKLARQVGEQGTVYACDIQKPLIDYIEKRVAKEG